MLMESDEVMIFVHWLPSPSTPFRSYIVFMDTDMAFLGGPAS